MASEVTNVKRIDKDRVEVTGIRKLHPWEIEYKGSPYNCNYCLDDDSKCCGADDSPPCEKCVCQMLHAGSNKDEALVPAHIMNCQKCDLSKYDKRYCSEKGLLENDVIQPIVVYDCSQKSLVSGDANEISNVQLLNACSGTIEVQQGIALEYIIAAIGALLLIVIGIVLFV